MAKINLIKKLTEITENLFKLMGVNAKIEVTEDKENDLLKVRLENETEKGLLIGKKGETINSIQLVLGMILKNEIGEWKRVQVDIGNWREKQEDYLKVLAEKTAQRAQETGEPQTLYNLNPTQRRVVHLEISKIDGVESESEGEGNERYLVIKRSGKH